MALEFFLSSKLCFLVFSNVRLIGFGFPWRVLFGVLPRVPFTGLLQGAKTFNPQKMKKRRTVAARPRSLQKPDPRAALNSKP